MSRLGLQQNGVQPKVIAITGGSCSGKTTLTRLLQSHMGRHHCEVIYQDDYYHDLSHIPSAEVHKINFDHPQALEFTLLSRHLQMLKNGEGVSVPTYDFCTRKRGFRKELLKQTSYVLVDGILLLTQKSVREVVDFSIFVDTDEETRLRRRLIRDVQERGRTEEGVLHQFHSQVKPMHDLFVEPTRSRADWVLSGEDLFSLSMDEVFLRIEQKSVSVGSLGISKSPLDSVTS